MAGGKAEQRDLRLRARRRSVRLRVFAVAAIAGLAILLGAWLYRSPAFTIRTVEVLGANRLRVFEVRKLAAIPPGATLLRLSPKQVERRLTRSPWIASVEVSRDFPDTLRIRVQERVPSAIVDLGGKNMWLVDASGVWLAKSTGDATATPVAIRDVDGLDPVPGRRTGSETLLNALKIVQGLDPALAAVVRTISAPAIDKTALITSSDVEIFVGAADDIIRKQQVALKILEEQAGKVVYINVRTVARPTWRGLDTQP